MGASLAEDRRAWGSFPGEVHKVFVEEYERTGAPPPMGVIAEALSSDTTSVSRALKSLCSDGLLAQPYGPRSPYIPLVRPDGTRVRPVLVEVGKEPEGGISAIPQLSTEELLEEIRKRIEKG